MMNTSDSCKDSASKTSDDDVCDVKIKLQNMSTADVSVCANCGKEGDDVNNICNKCKKTTYCNASCKKKHRHKHKKECEEHVRQAAEHAARLHDEKLFNQPPPTEEDCPICFLRLPSLHACSTYKSCCGKIICNGCIYAPLYDDQGNEVDNTKCPFCRTPHYMSDKENIERLKKRVEMNDPIATHKLGVFYRDGLYGLPQDFTKALELFHRAIDLGYSTAYSNIGQAYRNGQGVEMDKKKANHYWELAAMEGDIYSRHNLSIEEDNEGNFDRAVKHYMIAVRDGFAPSLNRIKLLYSYGHATKDDYTKALQSYQAYLSEIKSKQRDKAAAADEELR